MISISWSGLLDECNPLFETSEWTAVRDVYSGFSGLVDPMRSLRRRRYLGHLCTMVNNQSRNLSLPHRGSASWAVINEANAWLFTKSAVYEESASGKDDTKGVYRDR